MKAKPKTIEPTDPRDLLPIEGSPIFFAEAYLGMNLYHWQCEVLEWFWGVDLRRKKAALCTPNSAGKSSVVVAALVIWWMSIHKRGKVVITTKDSKQLDYQIFPAIQRLQTRLEGWKFIDREITTPTGGVCVLFTTDEAGRAEGWHKEDDIDGPLLMIVDEAKSVPDLIFQAIDRCTYNALLYVSSPGVKSGRFYDTFSKDMGFETKKVGLSDCPHIAPERIEDILKVYGADHPFTLSTLHGEFMDEDGENTFVISPSSVRLLMESPPAHAQGRRYGACDFAAGGDENVFGLLDGNKITLTSWKDANTMASVARFIQLFNKHNLKPSDIYGDNGGLGGTMIDRMYELGWAINRVDNGSEAQDPERYENRGAEMWHNSAEIISNFGAILPNDELCKAQLTTRKIKFLSDGRMGVESKKDMKKRGLGSPDRGDCCVMLLSIDTEIAAGEFDMDGVKHLESKTRPPKTGVIATADFGVNWTEKGDGWVEVWEAPEIGKAYLATLKHGDKGWSVFILRKSCHDENGKTMNDAAVCRIKPCDWDAALLADRLDILLKWYGNPILVLDVRNGLDVLERMKEKGASIHRRPVFDRAQNTSAYGWETTERNFGLIVSTLAKSVREKTLDVWSSTAVRDIRAFRGRNLENGDTLALGIGMQCMDAAQVYMPPQPMIQPHHFNHEVRGGGVAGSGACR